jgi:hypothetical protein
MTTEQTLPARRWEWQQGVEHHSAKLTPDPAGAVAITWTTDVSPMDDDRGYGSHGETQQPLADFIAHGPLDRAPIDLLAQMVTHFSVNPIWLDALRLQEAVMDGDIAATRALLQRGVAPDLAVLGATPLYWALQRRHLDLATLLLDAGVDVNRSFACDNGATALMVAARYANGDEWLPLIHRLIAAGADMEARAAWGETTLIHATRNREMTAVIEALLEAGADVNAASQHGYTALIAEGFGAGRPEVARLLLARGADVNARDDKGWPALMWAITMIHLEMVRVLIEAGADVRVVGQGYTRNSPPRSVLQLAEDYARVPKGWDLDAMHKSGRATDTVARLDRAAEVVRLLRSVGA